MLAGMSVLGGNWQVQHHSHSGPGQCRLPCCLLRLMITSKILQELPLHALLPEADVCILKKKRQGHKYKPTKYLRHSPIHLPICPFTSSWRQLAGLGLDWRTGLCLVIRTRRTATSD